MSDKTKKGLLIGFLFIVISAFVTMAYQHDIAFFFAGLGTIVIGVTILATINKKK